MRQLEFNPINNYYGLDLSINENSVIFNFWELTKNLVTLSSSSTEQKEITGLGLVAEEMAEDFHSYFTLQKHRYLNYQLIDQKQIELLENIDSFLDSKSGNNEDKFWNDAELAKHQDWVAVRQMANSVLNIMGYHELSISFTRTTKRDSNKSILIESTKTYLKHKER